MQSDTTGSLQEFHKILEEAGKKGASDIHYVPKEQLLLRIDGRLVDMTEEWNVSFSMEELIEKLLDKKQQKTFEENGEVEFSCPVFNKRVRVNLFRQSGTCAMSVRLFAEKIPTPQMLGLPESAVQMAGKRRGLILVTGASGSGRTTTMASMIDHIASNYERSILTLEKPAEYLFRSGKSMVLQREIGIDSRSYEAGLKAALKQDMDVILISEMEDLDTVSLALTAAEMGHLVIAALPTQNAVASIERIVECFPDHRQHQIRSQLSDVLAGVISQQLLPRLDGGGRVAAFDKGTEVFPDTVRDARLQKRGNGLHGRCRVRPLYEEYDRLGYCCLLCTGWCGHASESTVILNYYRNLKCFLKDNRCVDAISFEA